MRAVKVGKVGLNWLFCFRNIIHILDNCFELGPFAVVERGVGTNGCRVFHRVNFKKLNGVFVATVEATEEACDFVVVYSVIYSMSGRTCVTGEYKLNILVLAYNPLVHCLRGVVTIVAFRVDAAV